MNNKTYQIKRYPYCGFSHNLIELFLIVGYEHSYINNEVSKLIENEKNNYEILDEKEVKNCFKVNTNPSILSVISSDYKKEMISLSNIINFLFPTFPTFYYTSDNESNINLIHKFNNFIFQNNSTIENLKVSFNHYFFNYYEQFNIKHFNKKIYTFKFFVILFQYHLFDL